MPKLNRESAIAVVAFTAAIATACVSDPCTPAVPDLNLVVAVVDTAGASVAEGASGFAASLDDGTLYQFEPATFDSVGRVTGFGVTVPAGDYALRIDRPGFQTWSAASVTIATDGCLTERVSLTAVLLESSGTPDE